MTPDAAPTQLTHARFVERPNRFLVVCELEDGRRVTAHLPNTGRLQHLADPGTPYILRRDGVPPRKTEYTATRAWDGCWVALEASRAPLLLANWLESGNPFPGFGPVDEIRREVTVADHRLDLLLTGRGGTCWVEVKSGGRANDGAAVLSGTPSVRGMAHLDALSTLVADGENAAAAFVVQRSDAASFVVGRNADRGWIDAVVRAYEAGVQIAAFGCDVTDTSVRIARELSMIWEA